LEKTRKAYYACVDELHAAMGDLAKLPRPDGTLRNRNVGQAYRRKLREYSDAMIRLNRYLLDTPTENIWG